MKKSLTFRVISGVIVASTLLILPATASAAVRELTRPAPAAAPQAAPGTAITGGPDTSPGTATAGMERESDDVWQAAPADDQPGRADRVLVERAAPATLPFRISVPGAVATGSYTRLQSAPQITVSLKVTGQAPCGVLQVTRNGPADGIEWHTVGALCSTGTATFRAAVNRLWGSRSLPSIRLCNGDSLGLAEGVDCDRFTPPRGA
ncbi:hypothetical protein [Actinoplanes subglobosus]|uniref:Uncharacterized protein n=1 Tax=Actinoplanes subglobosus TaxID=1547892 RepID=A0ABV8J8T1_9ACTN